MLYLLEFFTLFRFYFPSPPETIIAAIIPTKTVTYNWTLEWVRSAPDNFSRPVIGINGKWPLPKLEADLGDTIVVHVRNNLGNETTSIHWHGQFQRGSAHMDGTPRVTQCGIAPDDSFTYEFVANPAGSSWYHSHAAGQYPDGLRGPIVIHDRVAEKALGFDEEYTLTMSDWYHDEMPGKIHYFLSKQNIDDTDAAEPIPQASLINDKVTETFDIVPGKKYLIRLIDMSALAAHIVKFEDHMMTVVAIDGVQVLPVKTDTVLVSAGQRYDVIITGKKNPKRNYAFVASMDPDMFDTLPDTLNMNSDGVLRYSKTFPTPEPLRPKSFAPLDDFGLSPLDRMPLLEHPDQTINLLVNFTNHAFGSRSALGPAAYITPKVPTLYTALTTSVHASNPLIYGAHTSPFILRPNSVVQIVLNNIDDGAHPFHLHGHHFQLVARQSTQPWDGDESAFPRVPMRRDTVRVGEEGSMVLRFRADNPGVWLFHCHVDWHVQSGLSVTFVEAPEELQRMTQAGGGVPEWQKEACRMQGVPTEGNCAGETEDVFDTGGCNADLSKNTHGALVDRPEG